jgi:hypothetical protein
VKPWQNWQRKGKPGTVLTVNFPNILIWGYELAKTKNKTCFDCLHCKVSAKSTANNRLCYCGKVKNIKNHKVFYWFIQKVCNAFEDMD